MLELLAVAMIVGKREIGPGLYEVQYLQPNAAEVVTVVEDVD